MQKWQTLRSQTVFDCPRFSIRQDVCRLPDGREIDDYFVLTEPDIASVFALTPAREVVLVEQYKHGIGEVILELPAGMFEPNASDPMSEARREFVEETGYDAAAYHLAATFICNPTRMNNHLYHFAAVDAVPVGVQQFDENEDITVRLVPLDDVFAMIADGRISAVQSVAGIYTGWECLRRNGLV